MMSSSLSFALLLLVQFSQWHSTVALPPGFVAEGIGRYKRITDISTIPLRPNGADKSSSILLVTLKEGEIYVLEDPDNKPEEVILAANISDHLCHNGERGIQSAIVHPNFRLNYFIYVYYTFKGETNCEESRSAGPANRCSRFKMFSNYTIDVSSERVLFQTSPLERRYHNGGDMVFGPSDGLLYVSIGDGGMTRGSRISQDRGDLLGTIVRISAGGHIPLDNPYSLKGIRCNATGYSTVPGRPCREIYAEGLRNPYKMAVDPNELNKTRILINDVGGQTWEETSWGGTDFPGANYGWPDREGPCGGFGDAGNNIEDCVPDSLYQEPYYFYMHQDKTEDGGGAIVGGAMIPNGYWPSKYDNGYFFADFVFGEIYHISLEKQQPACDDCDVPVSPFSNETFHSCPTTSAMVFAPYKDTMALYYGAQKLARFTLHRISYVGGDNVSPKAQVEASATTANVGEEIQFNGNKSNDPDGDTLSYRWDMGDGTMLEGAVIDHVFSNKGTFTAVLTVDDGNGGSNQDSVKLSIGSPPVATINEPQDGTKFAVGEIFTLQGSALDSEGNLLPDSALSWEVRQHHNTHYHPFLGSTKGNGISLFPAPAPEDFLAATNSHLEILLTATDEYGLSTTTSRIIMPKTVWLMFDTSPKGIDVYLDDYRITTPQQVLSWENHSLHVVVPTEIGELTFNGWSDGGGPDHKLLVPTDVKDDTLEFVASFESSTTSAPVGTAPTSGQPVLPSTTGQPIIPPTSGQPVLPPTSDQPIIPPTSGQPVLPPTSDQPVIPPTSDQPIIPPISGPIVSPNVSPVLQAPSQEQVLPTVDPQPIMHELPPILEARIIADNSGGYRPWVGPFATGVALYLLAFAF